MSIFKKNKYLTETLAVLERVNGKRVKYVAERESGTYGEIILGREGILVADHERNELAVMCDGTDVFVCYLETAQVSELMSLGGVVIKGVCPDGRERTVTAYFVR